MTLARLLSILLAWMPALLWAAVIWQLGGDGWSAPATSRFLGPLVDWLFPMATPETREAWVAGIRKLAHPAVYGTLTALAYPASLWTLRVRRQIPTLILTLIPVLALASADEWRQAGSSLRTGSGWDVLLDGAGAIAVLLLIRLGESFVKRRNPIGAQESRSI